MDEDGEKNASAKLMLVKQGLLPCAATSPPPPFCVPSNTVRQSATVSTALGLVIIDSKSVYLVWLPKDEWYRRYKIHKNSIMF